MCFFMIARYPNSALTVDHFESRIRDRHRLLQVNIIVWIFRSGYSHTPVTYNLPVARDKTLMQQHGRANTSATRHSEVGA